MIKFNKSVKRIVYDNKPLEEKEFIELLLKHKPTEIYHEYWSRTKPCWIITEYNDNGIMYYSNAYASEDRKPEPKSYNNLYNYLRTQGLQNCFING